MIALLLCSPALAASASGLGVPGHGGALSGPAEVGAMGLHHSPAAAVTERAEVSLDLAWIRSDLTYTLTGQETVEDGGGQAVPALAAAVPLGPGGPPGRVALGLALGAPFGRGGSSPEDGPGRWHNIDGGIQALEANLGLGWAPVPEFTMGVAGRAASLTMSTRRAVDTGALIADLAGADAEELLGDPFLEGRQELADGRGVGWGYAAGIRVHPTRRSAIVLHYRSRLVGTVEGSVEYVPSLDLDVQIDGTFTSTLQLPHELVLAGRVPLGPVVLLPEIGWIGWSAQAVHRIQPHGLHASSENDALDGILQAYGLTLDEAINQTGESVSLTGMHDILTGGVGVVVEVLPGWELRSGLWYAPESVPDNLASPSNLDFATWDLRLATAWEPAQWGRVGLGVDLFLPEDREIRDSELDAANPADSGMDVPSGNGDYAVTISRVGLTWIQRF